MQKKENLQELGMAELNNSYYLVLSDFEASKQDKEDQQDYSAARIQGVSA